MHANPAPSPRPGDERYGQPLTERELQVLRTLARVGHGREVARVIGTSLQHVKNLLTSAYAKLGADGALHAFALLGWLHVPEESA